MFAISFSMCLYIFHISLKTDKDSESFQITCQSWYEGLAVDITMRAQQKSSQKAMKEERQGEDGQEWRERLLSAGPLGLTQFLGVFAHTHPKVRAQQVHICHCFTTLSRSFGLVLPLSSPRLDQQLL